jgi:hypothetical protein
VSTLCTTPQIDALPAPADAINRVKPPISKVAIAVTGAALVLGLVLRLWFLFHVPTEIGHFLLPTVVLMVGATARWSSSSLRRPGAHGAACQRHAPRALGVAADPRRRARATGRAPSTPRPSRSTRTRWCVTGALRRRQVIGHRTRARPRSPRGLHRREECLHRLGLNRKGRAMTDTTSPYTRSAESSRPAGNGNRPAKRHVQLAADDRSNCSNLLFAGGGNTAASWWPGGGTRGHRQ